MINRIAVCLFLTLGLGVAANAADKKPKPVAEDHYSPYVETAARNLYWGDTHLHSALSVDAAVLGRTRLSPKDAYRFARGETVTTTSGAQARLIRPLDFMLLSDHAEYLGLMRHIQEQNPLLLATETGKRWATMIGAGGKQLQAAMYEILMGLSQPDKINSKSLRESIWSEVTANADHYNEPGKFTAFIGYEWTATTPNADNLHRNVIFRDGAAMANKVLPFSSQDSMDPQQLWAYLQNYEAATGGKAMAIPHNGNLSNGLMFPDQSMSDPALTPEYAALRARWEPLYEVTQIKGDGEAHPLVSPDDEFADYETWDVGNLGSNPKPEGALAREYARSVLNSGLALEARLGSNPYQFGMIGSTDSHTGLATAREDNFWGKFSRFEPNAERTQEHVLPPPPDADDYKGLRGWQSAASGYAAVWAEENTRESLFAAMQRKEVYATTGSRIRVRFFGGWDYDKTLINDPRMPQRAYKEGVPMGGELQAVDGNSAPRFLATAMKDPDGANLDRLQIIKGWQSKDGKLHERIYDIALGGKGRSIGKDGRSSEAVGNTVNVEDASYSNSIGSAQLSAYWQDPDFDAAESAWYYLRVIEIPTPRWTAYDAKFFDLKLGDDVEMVTQERAYTSPIWYKP
jgi:hypothetical protein